MADDDSNGDARRRFSRHSGRDAASSPSKSSHRRGFQLPKKGPLCELRRPGDRELSYGALRFAGSKRPPAKWVCVSNDTGGDTMKQLGELFRDTWKLRPPAVLISVTGAADRDMSAQMTDKQQLVFRRGLNQAAKITKAWVITGGTNAGVMSMVGRTLSHADHNLPCIGIATWGVVAGHEQMEAAQSGRVLRYAELLRNAAHDRKEARQAAGQDSASAYGGSEAPAPAQTSLEPNHSHFVLVDDGTVGKFGSEIQVRAALEDAICRRLVGGGGGDASEQSAGTPGGVDTASGGSAQSRQNASISQQPEAVTYDAELHSGARALATPMVLLVLNGGKGTLETVLETLKKDRPVVVLEDSGGCAADISRCAVATPARAAQRSTCSTLLLWPFLRCGDATHARCRSRAVPHTPRGARLGLLPLPPLTLCPPPSPSLPLSHSLSLTPSLTPSPAHAHTHSLPCSRVWAFAASAKGMASCRRSRARSRSTARRRTRRSRPGATSTPQRSCCPR